MLMLRGASVMLLDDCAKQSVLYHFILAFGHRSPSGQMFLGVNDWLCVVIIYSGGGSSTAADAGLRTALDSWKLLSRNNHQISMASLRGVSSPNRKRLEREA